MSTSKNVLNSSTWNQSTDFLRPNLETAKHEIWRPSGLEAAILQLHFQRNRFPTTEDKDEIIKSFCAQFSSQVTQAQLTHWFKNEREKTAKKASKEAVNSVYRKFKGGELDFLLQSFSQDNYPSGNQMSEFAKTMNCSLSKIENWYKHHRRGQAKQGKIKLKIKKYFKKDELSLLSNFFDRNIYPNTLQLQEMADKLNCTPLQMKSWFSNRRKRFTQKQTETEPEHVQIAGQIPVYDSQPTPSFCSNKQQDSSTSSHAKDIHSKTASHDPVLPTSSNLMYIQQLPDPQKVSTGFSFNLNAHSAQHTNNINNPFWARPTSESLLHSNPTNNSYLGFQNNFVSSQIENFPIVDNSMINTSLPFIPSMMSSNQPNTRSNERLSQQMPVRNFPTLYIAFAPISNIHFLNYAPQNNLY